MQLCKAHKQNGISYHITNRFKDGEGNALSETNFYYLSLTVTH